MRNLSRPPVLTQTIHFQEDFLAMNIQLEIPGRDGFLLNLLTWCSPILKLIKYETLTPAKAWRVLGVLAPRELAR